MQLLARPWKNAGITLKFGLAIGIILLLIIATAVISNTALNFNNQKNQDVQESTEIQQLVLEMNLGLQSARISERNFYLQYPIVGIEEARILYAQPAVLNIADVVSKSETLNSRIDSSNTIGASLQDSDVDLTLYLSAAERNAEVFLESVDLISQLAGSETGLEAQLAQTTDTLFLLIENEDTELLNTYYGVRIAESNYLQTRQRPFFQSAFNQSTVLRNQISASSTLSTTDKTTASELLDQYETIGESIIAVDVQLNGIFNDFSIQDESVDPISQQLIEFAQADVEQSQQEIEDTANLIQQLLILSALITLSIAVAAAFVLNQSITRNIIQLTGTAEQLQAGNLDARSAVNTGDELGQLSNTLNNMADRLKLSINTLEERVQARTRDLEIAAEVSKEAVSIIDPEELLPRVTKLTSEAFGLYYVSVFTYDEDADNLTWQAGASPQSISEDALKSRLIQISDKGIIPQAARERLAIVTNNTADSDTYVALDALPNTKSEAALPMIVGDQLIGVLDLQSDEIERFGQSELNVLQTLADRIAVTIRNAQLFAEQVEITEQLKLLDKLKSQFLASMSHELRTPLNAIINFTQFVSNGTFGEVNTEQSETLNKVEVSGRHLLSLINDILDFSKIEAGMLQLFMQDVNLAETLAVVQTTISGLEINDGVELTYDIADDLPETIRADKRRVRQILINLLSNAVKFTTEGSIILRIWVESNTLFFSVKDTGSGISQVQIKGIFEPFQQSDAGQKTGAGTGLGLPISRHLAEAHGGKLWVESQEGHGSTFSVKIPFQREVENVR